MSVVKHRELDITVADRSEEVRKMKDGKVVYTFDGGQESGLIPVDASKEHAGTVATTLNGIGEAAE